MYVAKFNKQRFFWKVTLFNKIWSEDIYSHEITEIQSKNFLFHLHGYRWIEKEVCKNMFRKHELEIIDG